MTTPTLAEADVRTAVRRWALTVFAPERLPHLTREQLDIVAAAGAADATDTDRDAAAAILRGSTRRGAGVDLLLAMVTPASWSMEPPMALIPIMERHLGLGRLVELAQADPVVLEALADADLRIRARVDLAEAVETAQAELADHGGRWSPGGHRLAWEAAVLAAAAGCEVTIQTAPDGLRLVIMDWSLDRTIMDAPIRAGIDQRGMRALPVDPRPVLAELAALDAGLDHTPGAPGPWERRNELVVRVWHMAEAAGWAVGRTSDPATPEAPEVAVVGLPEVGQVTWHLPAGSLPDRAAELEWGGHTRPDKARRIAAFLAA